MTKPFITTFALMTLSAAGSRCDLSLRRPTEMYTLIAPML